MTISINIPTLALLVVGILNIICAIAVLFFERKDPVVTLTWMIVLFFVPIVGLIFYFFFGRGLKVYTKKTLATKQVQDITFYEALSMHKSSRPKIFSDFEPNSIPLSDPVLQKYFPIIKMHYIMGHCHYTNDNSVKIYTTAREKYDDLLADIRSAKSTINMAYFIIRNDEIGREIISALAQSAKSGVKVRLSYDDLGSIFTSSRAFDELRNCGGEVYRFFPLKLKNIFRTNYRNHRKIVVIDGLSAYLGGMNIGNEYMGMRPKNSPWRDTHMKITGHAVHSIQARFLMDWDYVLSLAKEESLHDYAMYFPHLDYPISQRGNVAMQIVSSGPDLKSEQVKRGMIKLMNSATTSILIQTPYFIPDAPFLEALTTAAASGVKITLMIPGKPDKRAVYHVTTSYLEPLLEYNVAVYIYPGFLHSKMMVIDDEAATMGSCNIDIRSFSLHFEVNSFFYDKKLATQCSEIFAKDLALCKRLTMLDYQKRSLYKKAAEGVLRLFAPLM